MQKLIIVFIIHTWRERSKLDLWPVLWGLPFYSWGLCSDLVSSPWSSSKPYSIAHICIPLWTTFTEAWSSKKFAQERRGHFQQEEKRTKYWISGFHPSEQLAVFRATRWWENAARIEQRGATAELTGQAWASIYQAVSVTIKLMKKKNNLVKSNDLK